MHNAKERVRRVVRENLRAQRRQGNLERVFLGLQPPVAGELDPIFVHTINVNLTYKLNLGDDNNMMPCCTDWSTVDTLPTVPASCT